MAMHTWGRKLNLHPHIHCVVTGGGLTSAGEWKETGEYLLPGRQVRALYRGRLQAKIKEAYKADDLQLPPDHEARDFWRIIKTAYSKTWCVRIEKQYAHGHGVLKYLSRYLRGGPIHPGQLVRCDSQRIGFRYRDHRQKRTKVLELKPMEFVRRLLLHVPEPGQHMVRHYGLYAGAARQKRNQCREEIGGLLEAHEPDKESNHQSMICRGCGAVLRLKWALFPRRRKGNSYKVESMAEWHVQQVDEPVIGQGKKKITALRL